MTQDDAYKLHLELTHAGYWTYAMFDEHNGYWVVVVKGRLV